jgi:hypothetical protein
MNQFIQIELKGYTQEEIKKMEEIFRALITSGGLTGVKGGQTNLHFDAEGVFMGVQLSYFPWRRKKVALDR